MLKPVASLCIIFSLAVLSVFAISRFDGSRGAAKEASYTITIRHHGVDAQEIERSISIPLEDALSGISGMKSILTSSENGRARAFARFQRAVPGLYEAVREAAQRVYEDLPRSAQRPEILSADDSRIPVWTAAVFAKTASVDIGNVLEKTVKPFLEGVDGAGEVDISGAGVTEIVVALKPDIASSRGLSASYAASVLASNDALIPGGTVRENGRDIIIMVDSRYRQDALKDALIPLEPDASGHRIARLSEIADVYEQEREPDTLSRLDGKKAAVVSVMAEAGIDLGTLSARLKDAIASLSALPDMKQSIEFEVLSDRGAEERAAYRSVLFAALQGALAVALLASLIVRPKQGKKYRIAIAAALTVPFICVVSAASLSLLGFPLDKTILAGLSVGLGSAVDAAILSAERLGRTPSIAEAKKSLKSLAPPLISGSATTIAALVPLAKLTGANAGITSLAWAVGTVTFVSLIIALTLLPPLFLQTGEEPSPRKKPPHPAARCRFFNFFNLRPLSGIHTDFSGIAVAYRFPLVPIGIAGAITVAGIAAIVLAGADVSASAPEDSVYAQVEFDGGFRAENGDELLSLYAQKLKARNSGIKSVQTSARRGSGSVLIGFDPDTVKPDEVRKLARNEPISSGFVYIPETSATERIWKITVSGDEDEKCREIAGKAAAICSGMPFAAEMVLDFKDGANRLTFLPDREKLASAGVSFSETAEEMRRGVYGPVAYKRIGAEGETDVRVRIGRETPSKEAVQGMILGGIRASDLMKGTEKTETSGIYRQDRRRVASFSIRTRPMDPRKARDSVMAALKRLDLPQGYAITFDRDAIEAAQSLSKTAIYFALAIVFCYMVIAASNESFGLPLIILSVVPPSLAVPALCMLLTGASITANLAAAFVAVSGMAVNAAVLVADSLRPFPRSIEACRRAIRGRLPSILATTGTTIAGALPFLFLSEGSNGMVKTLSLVSAMGVGASCVFSLFLLPALMKIASDIRDCYFFTVP